MVDIRVEDSLVGDIRVEDSLVGDIRVEDSLVEDSLVGDIRVEDSLVGDSLQEDSHRLEEEEPLAHRNEPYCRGSASPKDLNKDRYKQYSLHSKATIIV